MRATDHLGIGCKLPRPFATACNTKFFERRDYFVGPAATTTTGCGKPRLQIIVGRIDAEADYMYRLATPRHRNFNAIDEFQSKPLRSDLRERNSAGVVMIRKREYRKAALNGT